MLKCRRTIPLIHPPPSAPFSPPSSWASAVAASGSIISARTAKGFDLVGDSSDDSVQSQSTKSLGEFLGLPIAPPTNAAEGEPDRNERCLAPAEEDAILKLEANRSILGIEKNRAAGGK